MTGLAFGAAGRRGGGLCASLGVLAMQLLFLSGVSSLATVEVRAGYWFALFFMGAAGIHLLVVRFAERRRQRMRIWPPVAGAVLMALPTGLFVLAAGAS